ncbi:hypothetical protein SERLA73DRAFT_120584 [Serpula lacrymans var. lacrymans S7.3]|uniref:Uncharacterized protein n=2 Tax=Serpula lacrymans var. lacrymans TaxID=341189 RepID=F8PP56_SERL3|nr:uncharacterized protein SERLADRAFT_367120 [Serpula lacrymans var. lacrymans S7.9]EGO01933.1 hypothetical protein SERLA73DRAFT_120584 [Serpula lacrymans var. lacrymans S7.3]EGO27559.1 hypothetical protein SERLADRAFT_367120 [Serpula lacrymans var. lacrymans S7.9]
MTTAPKSYALRGVCGSGCSTTRFHDDGTVGQRKVGHLYKSKHVAAALHSIQHNLAFMFSSP